MIHANDTHVLIDALGTAVMSGTLETIEFELAALLEQGIWDVEIRTIGGEEYWDWTMIDWGDD